MVETNIAQARFNMIQQQIRPWDVMDQRVLRVLAEIPRESFVPQAYRNLAFADIEIPLEHGEVMMPPKLEARMLQALAVKGSDKVLEIGTGSGFVTACLSRLAAEVTSLDIRPELVEQAKARLEELGITNVRLRSADALTGSLGDQLFDAIAVTGSVPTRDQVRDLQQLLAIGGRLFVVTGEAPAMEALLITRLGADSFGTESLFETELPPLVNARAAERFTF